MLKAIKIRLYPNKAQQIEINQLLGSCRFVYNYCLEQKIAAYNNNKTSLGLSDLNKKIIELKNSTDYNWLKEAHSKVIQQSLINLISAYSNFFKNKKGFPKFKSKNNNINSCRFPIDAFGGIKGNRINLITKIKNVFFKCSAKEEKYINKNADKIKSATLSKTKSGKYFLSILIDNFISKQLSNENVNHIVGIDMGIKDFVVQSDGKLYENIKIKRNNELKLIRLSRALSKKQKGSQNKNKARIKLAQFNEKLNNKKEYYLHYVSNILLNENQVIVMENLKISNMMKNHNLAKSIQELSLGKFKSILQYKSVWYNRNVVEVDTFFPSSKLCSECNYKNNSLKLKDRDWACPQCGVIHDRDVNAAVNIKKEGLRLYLENKNNNKIGLSKSEYTPVENGSVDDPSGNTSLKSTHSMKQEDKVVRLVNVFEGK